MQKARYAKCDQCPLKNQPLVRSHGPKDLSGVRLIVVGEGPGFTETAKGQPFVGPSGRLLRHLLIENGFNPDTEVYYTNAVLCQPPIDGKDAVMGPATEACKQRLLGALSQFEFTVPALVLGSWAKKALGIAEDDVWFDGPDFRMMLGSVHPAAVLRKPGQYIYLARAVQKVGLSPNKVPAINHGAIGQATLNPSFGQLPNANQGHYRIVVDIETRNLEPWYKDRQTIFMVGVAFSPTNKFVFTDDYLDSNPRIQAWLVRLIENNWKVIGGHGFKFDLLRLHARWNTGLLYGWDTRNMTNVLHEGWYKDLKSLVSYYYDVPDYSESLVTQWLKENGKKSYADVPQDRMITYLASDLGFNWLVAEKLEELLKEAGRFEMPYLEHEMPQARLLAQMEWDGFKVDLDKVQSEDALLLADEQRLAEEVVKLSGGFIENPNSRDQVANYLFGLMDRRPNKFTPTGKASVDEEILKSHKDLPAIEALLAYRRTAKLRGSYLSNLPAMVDDAGYAHSEYKDWNVITHRLSAEGPAIQTIPHPDPKKDTIPTWLFEAAGFEPRPRFEEVEGGYVADYGTRIKTVYTADSGEMLLTMDGAGWEVTVAAALSGDRFLIDLINSGGSIHNFVSDNIFGAGQWDGADKVRGKNVYFGWQYRGSIYGLHHGSGVPIPKVERVVDWLNDTLTGVVVWQKDVTKQARGGKLHIPFFNYTIHFDLINEETLRNLDNVATNYPVQGAGSMIISRAAYTTAPHLKAFTGAKVKALVHDDYTVSVRPAKLYEAALLMQDGLEKAGAEFNPTMKWNAEFKVGPNWGEMRKVSLEELRIMSNNYVSQEEKNV